VRRQTEQLSQQKEQYIRLRSQFQDEQRESAAKLLHLQRELRAEQKLIDKLEAAIADASASETTQSSDGTSAAAAIEQIWQLMQTYREAVPIGADKPDAVWRPRGPSP
jgi:seryl-tRNA synthetase